jgi:hypothetical protein
MNLARQTALLQFRGSQEDRRELDGEIVVTASYQLGRTPM